MYKSSLQILCQKKHWDLPFYETSKQGLDHLPKFTATVNVNGLTFQTPNPCGTAKEAQNEAALVAFQYLSNHDCSPLNSSSLGSVIPSAVSADSSAPIGYLHSVRPAANQNSQAAGTSLTSDHAPKRKKGKYTFGILNVYKNQLLNYAQKRSLVLPIYSSRFEGPPHAPRYKSNVTINGHSYECTEYYSTVKDAEQDAARVALMSLVPSEEDEAAMFKNLLQVLAQRNGLQVPAYMTDMSGRGHRPIFVSTVEIGGRAFIGQEAGSKKQAEINAARVAYKTLKDCLVIPSTVSADSPAFTGSLHSDIPAVKQNSPVTGTALTSDHVPKPSVIPSIVSADSLASIGPLHSDIPPANQNSQSARTALTSGHAPKRIQNSYKNQLQNYAQKRTLALPVYSSVVEHAHCFKANVTLDGKSYVSTEFHSNVEDAEQDAARVALTSLVPSEEDEAGSMKNLTQVCVKRNGPEVLAYGTNMSAGGLMPVFVSTAETGGQSFIRQEAGSKKQTEINADRVACYSLKDRSVIPGTVSADSSVSVDSLHSDRPPASQNSQAHGAALPGHQVPKHGIQNVYKNQLQNYAQKRRWALPIYSSIVEGPPHARRFKANVTIDGQSYGSIEFHSTMKDAEQDAARVALMSLVPSAENEVGLLKNFSKVSAQRNGLEVPANVMNMSAGGPLSAFVSSVETGGQTFAGQEARSKKQTEINADRIACKTLKDGRSQDRSELFDTLSIEPSSEVKSNTTSFSSLHGASASPPQKSTILPSVKDELAPPPSAYTEQQAGIESVPNGYFSKVVVYPRSAGKNFEGGSVLPISDDQWMAVEFIA